MAMKKPLPSSLLALGRSTLPKTFRIGGKQYRFAQLFKHDFFAATALYESADEKVVLKIGRTADFFGMPAMWVGRFLARREESAYLALADLESVPGFLGRWGPTAIVHQFIEGQPLSRERTVPDDFFQRLREAIQALHARDMAYVDLEKRQNVLVGDDGKPYLIDFQIAWHLPEKLGGQTRPARWLRRRLQAGDRYHLLKLQRRIRRDQLTDEQIRASYRKPPSISLHRWITAPFTKVRRAVLKRVDPSRRLGERGSITP